MAEDMNQSTQTTAGCAAGQVWMAVARTDVQSTSTNRDPQYGQTARPPSASIGRYTRGCEFHSAMDGVGQHSGSSLRRTSWQRSALAGAGAALAAFIGRNISGRGPDILPRQVA